MGKKTKLGKRRRDRFYHLAKETGYRARSAFKLIQLNRKYQFLQQSRVLIDLCAAPGGWLQVAAKSTPVSSLVVGVDLVPIKPIPKVITLQEDITADRCKQQLQKQLQTWKADCVLNDGAPNVGSAWVQDAFSQAELTLSALKLACEFLREGGWFITKVFRSRDYQPLMWVFQQLFHKVHATKPQASRIESAEIFVVCQGYLAPSKIDPKLLDPRHVFKEVEEIERPEQKVSLAKLQNPPKTAEGYPDNTHILYKSTPVCDFITSDSYLTLLSTSSKLHFDKPSEVFFKHSLTTEEIKQNCEDIKVLGPKELKQLVRWREKMRRFLEEVGSDEEGEGEGEGEAEEDELARVDARVQTLRKEEIAEVKRERKRLRKQRHKLKERLVKKAETHKESGELLRQEDLFRLKAIKSRSQLEEVERGEMVSVDEIHAPESEEEGGESESEGENVSSEEEEEKEEEEEEEGEEEEGEEEESEGESEDEVPQLVGLTEKDNPLLVSLESAATTRAKRTRLWFSKDVFEKVDTERDEDEELKQTIRSHESRGGRVWSKEDAERERMELEQTQPPVEKGANSKINGGDLEQERWSNSDEEGSDIEEDTRQDVQETNDSDSPDSETSESSDESDSRPQTASLLQQKGQKVKGKAFEIVPMETRKPTIVQKLDPEGLAIGALVVQSRKKREDLIECAYNRWVNNDENLPDWFAEDEAKFCQKQLPVTKEMVQEYRAKLREINARPIKKIAEAKARKKRKMLKKFEKARKKAEAIPDTVDVTHHEKMEQIKQIYKKAGLLGKRKREVQYVVAKKGLRGRRARPAGVKGRYRMVDPRMKKDTRARNAKMQKQKKGKRRH